jgi:D-sedoheptulose 7-phosphate isomerase
MRYRFSEYPTIETQELETNNSQYISQYYSQLETSLKSISPAALGEVVSILKDAAANHKTIYICGNGGSAETASHMACDLAKGTRIAGFPYIRAFALTDSMAQLSAWANDTSYDNCFSGQLEGLGQAGDILIAISGSGNSANVLKAVETAEELGMTSIGFIGFQGGKLKHLVDYPIVIPAENIELVEDVHMSLVHSIATALRSSIRATLKFKASQELKGELITAAAQ